MKELDLESVLYEHGFRLVSTYLGKEFKNQADAEHVRRMFTDFRDRLEKLVDKYKKDSELYEKSDGVYGIFKSRHNSKTKYLAKLLKTYDEGYPICIEGAVMEPLNKESDKLGYVHKCYVVVMKNADGTGAEVKNTGKRTLSDFEG